MKTKCAYSLSVVDKEVAVACTDGIIRIFDPISLQFIVTLPKPHALGDIVNLTLCYLIVIRIRQKFMLIQSLLD